MERHDLAMRCVGEGFPVLIVHGWTMSGLVEANDFEPVFEKQDGYRRIYVDLPGMGKSLIGGAKNLDSILESLSRFVEKHILPSNFLLTGSSCGAYLARALVYRYASSIDGLLLRVPLVEPVDSKRDVDQFVPAISDPTLMSSMSAADREKLGEISVQTPEYIDASRRRLEDIVLPAIAVSDSSALDPIRDDVNAYKLTAAMHTPDSAFAKPTLIITARQDTVVGYRDPWSLVASYPRATFATLDRADHGLPVDESDVDLFEALVVNWLRRVEELQRMSTTTAQPNR